MRKNFKIILLSFLPVFVCAQSKQEELDRWQTALKNATNDTISLDNYFKIALYYNEVNSDSSLFYLAQSLPIAQKLKLKLDEAHILENRGFMLTNIGKYPEALESFLQALKIAEDPSSEKITWKLPKDQSPRNKRLSTLGYIYFTMGHLYGATGNSDKQMADYHKAISIAESIRDTALYVGASNSAATTYIILDKLDSAFLFEQRVIDMALKRGVSKGKYNGLYFTTMGRIYQLKGDLNLSMNAFQKAIDASIQQNNLTTLAGAYLNLSRLYQTLQKTDSSLFYAMKALEVVKKLRQSGNIRNAYLLLSDIYSDHKNKDSTLFYLKLYTALNDSLSNVERKNLLAYQNLGFEEQMRVKNLEEEKIQTKIRTRANAMLAGLAVFLIIGLILYRNNRQKQKANKVLETTLTNLKFTQSQLIQSEKMASLGELTAGIAHEIQNPLNFVNNFSEVNTELIDEMQQELKTGNNNEAIAISNNIKENQEKINHHGKRADAIVKGMLQHSRSSNGVKEPTDINALADKYLRLSYHGLRAKDKSFNATMKTDFDESIGNINIIPQDIGRVILNLITNAFYAVTEKKKQQPDGYEPIVSVSTKKMNDKVEIIVGDNGNGIPQEALDKIFQPFFTTKPTGQGTGLGLSLSYDIVKAHGGELKVETNEGEGSEFRIQLPARIYLSSTPMS